MNIDTHTRPMNNIDMKNLIEPIKDAAQKVVDFVVEYECDGCRARREKFMKFARGADKRARDLLRRRKRR